MDLQFWKLTGAGNDFVVINNMAGRIGQDEAMRRRFVATLCARGTGVGADGLLMTEPSKAAEFRMRYYNSDGGEAETCGNGARCIARFAHLQGIAGPAMRFETKAGVYEASITPDAVRVSMSDAHSLTLNIPLTVPSLYDGTVDFINTGVPHVVVRVDDIEEAPVLDLGRAIRHHARFAPAGTNVNFIASSGEDHLVIRTYERGVENETLACGTGSIGSAIIAARRGVVKSPVRLTTRSGVVLTIFFEPTETGARAVELEGEARVVFEGRMPWPV